MTNKKILMTSIVAMTFLAGFSAQNVFSHGTVDQQSGFDPSFNYFVRDNIEERGQVFIPTADNLVAVDLALLSNVIPAGPILIGQTFDIVVHEGIDPNNLLLAGESRVGTVTSYDGVTAHLDLDSPVALVPGQPYILELETSDGQMIEGRTASTDYPYGNSVFWFNGNSGTTGFDLAFRTYFELTMDVDIDIKPGNDPNSINPKSMGLVPVAILGSDSFDVLDVDVTTLEFGPDGASPVHVKDGTVPDDHYEDVNDDGETDLVTHYIQKETGASEPEACLIGQTLGGIPFEGCDSVRNPGNN